MMIFNRHFGILIFNLLCKLKILILTNTPKSKKIYVYICCRAYIKFNTEKEIK